MSTANPDDIVRVASGTVVQVEIWQGALQEAGVPSRVVGTDLSAGLGTALGGGCELWVHRGDEPKAVEVLTKLEEARGHLPVPDEGK